MISELPWNVHHYGCGSGDLIKQKYANIWGNEVGERIGTEIKLENAQYIVDVCNVFPEVIETLRMVLHDTLNYDLRDKAEMIMNKAYEILNKNNIKPPKF